MGPTASRSNVDDAGDEASRDGLRERCRVAMDKDLGRSHVASFAFDRAARRAGAFVAVPGGARVARAASVSP